MGNKTREENKIKCVIVDNNKLYRESIKMILEKNDRIFVYGEYSSGESLLSSLETPFRPDVIIMNLLLKGMSGIECAKKVRENYPNISIILMTSVPDAMALSEADKIDIDLIEKGPEAEYILNEVINAKDSIVIDKVKATSLKKDPSPAPYPELEKRINESKEKVNTLSKTQLRILMLRKERYTYKEIATMLKIEVKTVDTHVQRAMKKLNLPNLLDYII